MQKYIIQLLELIKTAEENRPVPSYIEIPEEMEVFRDLIELEKSIEEDEQTMENIFGMPQYYFPPENRLTDEQILMLKTGIVELWSAFNYQAEFREGEFDEREQYTKLVENWKEHVPIFQGTYGTWHIEMYDYEKNWDEDEMRYLSEEEYYLKHFK